MLKTWPEDGGPLHHAAAGVHARSGNRHAQHRHVPHAGVRPPHDRHALAAPQGRRAAPSRRRAAGQAARSGGRARRRSRADLLRHRADARRARRADARRACSASGASSWSSAGRSISRCRPTRRSCSRATSSPASGAAKARSAITPGFYSLADDYPVFHLTCITMRKNPIYVTTVVGIPPMEDYYLGKASERIFLPLIRKTRAGDRRHALSGGRHLSQHRARLDRQALSGPRAQDHERVLGARPAHVLQVHRRRRQGRERAGRGGGRVDRRHARRSVARHRRSSRGRWTIWTTPRSAPAFGGKMGIDATRKWAVEGFTREWPKRLATTGRGRAQSRGDLEDARGEDR